LLRRELRFGREVLQRAAATGAKVRAAGGDARRSRLEYLEQLAVIVLAMAPRAAEAYQLTGECTGDEGGLATVHHALPLVREPGNASGLFRAGVLAGAGRHHRRNRGLLPRADLRVAHAPSCHARRNSAKCSSLEALK